jgi:hypothetical protein
MGQRARSSHRLGVRPRGPLSGGRCHGRSGSWWYRVAWWAVRFRPGPWFRFRSRLPSERIVLRWCHTRW